MLGRLLDGILGRGWLICSMACLGDQDQPDISSEGN